MKLQKADTLQEIEELWQWLQKEIDSILEAIPKSYTHQYLLYYFTMKASGQEIIRETNIEVEKEAQITNETKLYTYGTDLEKFKESQEKGLELIYKLANETEKDGWVHKIEKEGGMVSSKSVNWTPITYFRGNTVVNASAKQILQLVLHKPNWYEWDPFLKEVQIIEELDEKNRYVYLLYKGMFPVLPRDIVYLQTWGEKDGSFVVYAKSTEHPKQPLKPLNECVRANVLGAGFAIKPIGPTVSLITYIPHCDLGGNIPAALSNIASVEQPLIVNAIRKSAEKQDKSN